MIWKLNTSNAGKLKEYQQYLGQVEAVKKDLDEPEADPLTIIRYKASQFEGVIVDDVSLDVEGADVGSLVKWKLQEMDKHLNRRAIFKCWVGIHRKSKIEIFYAETAGILVPARGGSFGFNPYFLPDGSQNTFGEEIPKELNPRFKALSKLIHGRSDFIEEPLFSWNGPFQKK